MSTLAIPASEAAQSVELRGMTVGRPRAIVRIDPHQVCRDCGERRSRFQFRGTVRADRDHTLCFECYRALVNRVRADRLAGWLPVFPLASPMPLPARLTPDRDALVDTLRRRRLRAQIAARHAAEGLTLTLGAKFGMSEDRLALQKVS